MIFLFWKLVRSDLINKIKKILPIFFIATENDNSKLNCVTHINNIRVYIEVHRVKKVKQCYRCQRFLRSSVNCTMAPRCVKCGGNHLTSGFSRTDRSSPARCCNCNGEHLNVSGFPSNPINRKNTTLPKQTNKKIVPITLRSPQFSHIQHLVLGKTRQKLPKLIIGKM